jgi:UDP-N-acetyl-D-mannosaminuronic acid dehydrogenase
MNVLETAKLNTDRPIFPPVKTVSIIGLGYVGLPAAAMFAKAGLRVYGVDIDARIVSAVNAGETHIIEPGLGDLVRQQVQAGRLSASTECMPADAFIIAVPTPFRHDGTHSPDISYVEAAARGVAPILRAGNLVILESTSPVGTTRHVINVVRAIRPDLKLSLPGSDSESDVDFVYSPERVIPGRTMEELVSNDRVIGGITKRASRRAVELYGTFVKGECLVTTDIAAELVKLSENTFRDVNIALANELSMICDHYGIDVWEVIELANRHPRVSILSPGPGVGGHCISVDPWFIVAGVPQLANLIRTAREVNDTKPKYVLELVERAIGAGTGQVACLGLTYKQDIDDFRESPALEIALQLSAKYVGRVVAVDPFSNMLQQRDPRGRALTIVDYDAAIANSGVIVSLVAHSEFRSRPKPIGKLIIDTIGLWR